MLRVVNRIHQQCVQFVYFAVSFGAYLLSLIQSVRVRMSVLPSILFSPQRKPNGWTKDGHSHWMRKGDILT